MWHYLKVGAAILLLALLIENVHSKSSKQQKIERKKKLLKMLNQFESMSGKNKDSKNLGEQFGTKLLDTTGKRVKLKSGKRVFEINCAPSDLLKSKLKTVKSFVWERKQNTDNKFSPIVGISSAGKLYWAEKADWQRWIKFNELLTFESADGKVGKTSTAYFKLYIPLGNCEEETGSYRCKIFGNTKSSGMTKLEKYFKFKEAIDRSCSGQNKKKIRKKGKNLKGKSSSMDIPAKGVGKTKDGIDVDTAEKKSEGGISMALVGSLVAVIIVIVAVVIILFTCRQKTAVSQTVKPRKSVHSATVVQPRVDHVEPEETNEGGYRPEIPEGAPDKAGLFADIHKLRVN